MDKYIIIVLLNKSRPHQTLIYCNKCLQCKVQLNNVCTENDKQHPYYHDRKQTLNDPPII